MSVPIVYSVFLRKRFDGINNIWNEEIVFYQFDFYETGIDIPTDWRFKEVKNKRTLAIFMGLYYGTFPVELPIGSNIDFVINKRKLL